jgi:NADH:ubiquinone oxidoreductase subunit 6 (subunit J)
MSNFLMSTPAYKTELNEMAEAFQRVMKDILGPILIVVGAAAAMYTIYLGIMYAKAEDANKRKEVQGRLIGAAIGVVIILVGITVVYAVDWTGLGATLWPETTTAIRF